MFEKIAVIDPGARWIRVSAEGSRKTEKERGCLLKTKEQVFLAEEAILQSWNHMNCKLRHCMDKNGIIWNPKPLLELDLERLGLDKAVLKPSAVVLLNGIPDEKQQNQWQTICRDLGFGRMALKDVLFLETSDFQLHIHAGHSCTRIGLFSRDTIIAAENFDCCGEQMDQDITEYIARKYRTMISLEDAASLREAASSAFAENRNPTLSCLGMDRHSHFVRIEFSAFELWPSIRKTEEAIAEAARSILARVSVEAAEKAGRQPVILSGGLSHCFGLSYLLSRELGMKCAEKGDVLIPSRRELTLRPL